MIMALEMFHRFGQFLRRDRLSHVEVATLHSSLLHYTLTHTRHCIACSEYSLAYDSFPTVEA